jgi:hypothetical protein
METDVDFCKELERPLMSQDFFSNKEISDFLNFCTVNKNLAECIWKKQ